MVGGFNHNIRYKNTLYHVQTEDSGRKNPHIITLLYRGGNILASKKTSYADILKVDNLESVVEELMKDQHKEMLRRLSRGELDELIESRQRKGGAERTAAPAPESAPDPAPPAPAPAARPSASGPPSARRPQLQEPSAGEACLDDIILSYLVGEEDEDEER